MGVFTVGSSLVANIVISPPFLTISYTYFTRPTIAIMKDSPQGRKPSDVGFSSPLIDNSVEEYAIGSLKGSGAALKVMMSKEKIVWEVTSNTMAYRSNTLFDIFGTIGVQKDHFSLSSSSLVHTITSTNQAINIEGYGDCTALIIGSELKDQLVDYSSETTFAIPLAAPVPTVLVRHKISRRTPLKGGEGGGAAEAPISIAHLKIASLDQAKDATKGGLLNYSKVPNRVSAYTVVNLLATLVVLSYTAYMVCLFLLDMPVPVYVTVLISVVTVLLLVFILLEFDAWLIKWIHTPLPWSTLTFFVHGFQSWGFTGTIRHGQLQQRINQPIDSGFHNGATLPFTYKAHYTDFTSNMFGIISDHKQSLLLGWLSQKAAFGLVYLKQHFSRCEMILSCDEVLLSRRTSPLVTDWAVIEMNDQIPDEPMANYMEAVGIFNHARSKEAIPAGWCSWYEYFEKPSEEIILTNLGVIDKWKKHLPLKIVQLDDGFQTAWGDWHGALPRFPKGLAPLSAAIAEKGFTPGLWLAPVSIDKFSKLLKTNPKWALKKGSSFAHCGFNNRFAAGLDITMPQVQLYLKELISSAVTMWGMRYLKLDFLYACIALGDRYDMTMTRAEAMQVALSIIRQAAGEDTYILGCGCPQGSGIGYVDSMRVSADAGPSWFPDFPFQNDKNNHPGCRNSVRNTINKMSMHRRWWVNDPDCMLIRNTTKITFDELKGIGTVTALSGGSFFISDRLDTLTEERLQFAQRFMPISGVAGVVHDVLGQEMPEIISLSNLCDQVGEWSLLGVCNWGDHSANKSVDISKLLNSMTPLGSTTKYVHVYEFWTETYTLHAIRDTHLRSTAPIPSHSAFLYSIRPFFSDKASYVGSNIHFTMGTEVKEWDATFGRVVLHLHKHKVLEKDFFVKIYIPGDPVTSVKVSGDAARCTEGTQDKSNLSIWKIQVGCSLDNVALNRVEVMW